MRLPRHLTTGAPLYCYTSLCMVMTLFGKSFRLPILRIVLFCFVALIVAGMGWFAYSVRTFYVAIKSGAANPLLERRLESSVSRLIANANVTPEDLTRLQSSKAPTLGNKDASLTIVEFVDFSCPFTQATFAPVREVMEQYKDRVHLLVRNFPLEDIHPDAMNAAFAAGCADAQGSYWPYHDKLFSNQDKQSVNDLKRYAREIGLDENKFNECFSLQQYANNVQQDLSDGLAAGVQGTPTFFFNGVKVQGALDKETLELLVKQFLKTS